MAAMVKNYALMFQGRYKLPTAFSTLVKSQKQYLTLWIVYANSTDDPKDSDAY